MKIRSFDEARERLRQFYGLKSEYNLETIREFMAAIGNPQNNLKIVHLAGTSGKTSTTYYIAALLRAAGYQVGSTVSPHVDEINERVQINLVPLPEAQFCSELGVFLELVAKSEFSLTYFEVMIAFAYWYFDKAQVDFAVIETGLGGRLDPTNIVDRADKVCVITTIGLDHTKILGSTLPQIAAEKAGIIQRGNRVFTYRQADEIMAVFRERCTDMEAELVVIEGAVDPTLQDLPLFQQHNFQLARTAAKAVLQRTGKVWRAQYETQALATYIPARMERMRYHGRDIIVDGAHNGQKLQSLCASIQARYPGKRLAAVMAFTQGDDVRIEEGLQAIMRAANRIILTEFSSEQGLPKRSVGADILADYCYQSGYDPVVVEPDPERALQMLSEYEEDVLLVAGSFYLLNSIRPIMTNNSGRV